MQLSQRPAARGIRGADDDPRESTGSNCCAHQPGPDGRGRRLSEEPGRLHRENGHFRTGGSHFRDGIHGRSGRHSTPHVPFALRVEHRARWIDGLTSRSHPFLGLGVRFIRRSLRFPFRGPKRVHWELAAGYQQSLSPILGNHSVFRRSAVVGREGQWLNSDWRDRLRAELNAGFEFRLPESQRLLVQATVASMVAGPDQGAVQPGVSIGYAW